MKNILHFIRWFVYVLMMWLRAPIVLLCNVISGPFFFLWLFSWYAFPDKKPIVWGFCLLSLGSFSIMILYDTILLKIAPMNVILSE